MKAVQKHHDLNFKINTIENTSHFWYLFMVLTSVNIKLAT